MRADLPAGTVTFLFTDIEGSTRLLHDLGDDAYAGALSAHRLALRASFARRGGVEVDTQGDAFFFAFSSAPAAVAAAVEGQQALSTGLIRVRMGLHSGSPLLTDEGYVGVDVHRAARIAAVAHGGQVLLSGSTAALADSADLLDLGLHRLKDLSAAEHIFQTGIATFPKLRSLYRTNLPVPPTPFVGRDNDLEAIVGLLIRGDSRVVTLTGPGGSGKTRLALEVAARVADRFPDGVFWVPLAAVADSRLVPAAATTAIGATGSIGDWLAGRGPLIVLDNLEHLLDAANWVAELVAACSGVRLLVTSREPLQIAAEQQYDVSPLNESDSVELFTARARAVSPAFRADPRVLEICRRLDHLPLAIELAAAWVKALPTAQLLDRLDDRLSLLMGGRRDAPARHRTLRATVAWSHDLLDDREQQLFRRLAIFAGGCTLDAARDVVGGDLETIESLVDKSLVRRAGNRYLMLETVREYALEKLGEDGEADELHRKHADHFAALAQAANLTVETCDLGQRHELITPEIANLRAAIDNVKLAGGHELALSITVTLEQFWVASSPEEGRQRLTTALHDLPADIEPRLRARATRALSGVTYILGDFDAGIALVRQALDIFQAIGDDVAVGHLYLRIASDAIRVGHKDEALRLLAAAEALPAARSDEAQRMFLRAEIAWRDNRHDDALHLLRLSADTAAEIGFVWWQGNALLTLAEYAFQLDRPQIAAKPTIELLEIAQRIDDRLTLAYGLSLTARYAAPADDFAAGTWWGAVQAESQRAPIGQWDAERDELESHVIRHTQAFATGRAHGQSMSLSEAARRAVDFLRGSADSGTEPSAAPPR